MIPYGRQDIQPEDIEAVLQVLRSPFLTQGPQLPAFEAAVAAYCGAPQACATSNASNALILACRALGLGSGDQLWTSPITFVASANCALHCGATVDFVDIDPSSGLMCVAALEAKLRDAERGGRLPRIVVPVHYAGQSCDMRAMAELADRYGFALLEDAAHALGGRYQGQPVGSCQFSDACVFSFHPVKPITTGEGGMVLCRDAELAARMRRLRGHGITREPAEMQTEPPGDWYYEQQELGFNFRMTDMQAALGCSQLQRLDDYVSRRAVLAGDYVRQLADWPLSPLAVLPDVDNAWHLFVIRLDDPAWRGPVFQRLRAAGIGVNVHYIPVHWHPSYRSLGFKPGDWPAAEAFYAAIISLPLHPGLSADEQQRVLEVLEAALTEASGGA